MRPSFPLKCGVYTLHDYKHAEKEAGKIKTLGLAIFPNRLFDPNKTAYHALEQAKLTKVDHVKDRFDDLFSLAESMTLVMSRARAEYKDDNLVEFHRLIGHRLQTLPLDLLSITPTDKSSEPEQQTTRETPIVSEVQKEVQEDIQEEVQIQTQEQSSMEVIANTQIDPKFLQEWQQLDYIINNLGSPKEIEASKATPTQETASTLVSIEASGPSIGKETEVIPKDPTKQIILQIEEIPPLDILYSPKHRAIVKRQRKRRRIDQPSLFLEQTITGNVLWKEEFNPSDDLTKLSQYAGAYSAETIDKASEVSNLIKIKDQEILALQSQLSEARQKAEQAE